MKHQHYEYHDKPTNVSLVFGFLDDENVNTKKRAFIKLLQTALTDLQIELPIIK